MLQLIYCIRFSILMLHLLLTIQQKANKNLEITIFFLEIIAIVASFPGLVVVWILSDISLSHEYNVNFYIVAFVSRPLVLLSSSSVIHEFFSGLCLCSALTTIFSCGVSSNFLALVQVFHLG